MHIDNSDEITVIEFWFTFFIDPVQQPFEQVPVDVSGDHVTVVQRFLHVAILVKFVRSRFLMEVITRVNVEKR